MLSKRSTWEIQDWVKIIENPADVNEPYLHLSWCGEILIDFI